MRCEGARRVLRQARPGDVVLRGVDDWASRTIRAMSGAPVSHAMIVVADQTVIEATHPDGGSVVKRTSFGELREKAPITALYLCRHEATVAPPSPEGGEPAGPSPDQIIKETVAVAEGWSGKTDVEFADLDLVLGGVLAATRPAAWFLDRRFVKSLVRACGAAKQTTSEKVFCSELVYRCFASAATQLKVPSLQIETPNLLLRHWVQLMIDSRAGRIDGPAALPDRAVDFDGVVEEDFTEAHHLRPQEQQQQYSGPVQEPTADEAPISYDDLILLDHLAELVTEPVESQGDEGFLGGVDGGPPQQEQQQQQGGSRSFRGGRRRVAAEIADLVTPGDLLQSPSLHVVAFFQP